MLCHGRKPCQSQNGRNTNRTTTPKTDATERVPPWEKHDGGPRSLVAASSDGGPCSVMAAGTRTEPRPQRRTRRSASLHGKNPMKGPGPLWPPLLMEGHAPSWPQALPVPKRTHTRTEPRPQRRTRRSASLHGKNMMEGHGPSWPLLLMEGHALSWPQALPVPKRTQHEPNHDPKDGRDGARPSMEKPDEGPRSLMAASSDGGPCSVMAASTRTEPRPQRRTRRSASLQGKRRSASLHGKNTVPRGRLF
jgi:hypothetical protein